MTRSARRALGSAAALAAAAGAIALAPAAGAAPARPAPAPVIAVERCQTGQLAARLVPSSPGAGQRYAMLVLTNRSKVPCHSYGYPGLRLLDAHGRPLPTKAVRDTTTPPRRFVLPPGGRAASRLHWGAVPGPGEPTTGQCQPTPARLQVTPPDEWTQLTIPWTGGPVCQGGRIDVGPLRRR